MGASVHHSATVRQGPALATTRPPSAPSPITRSGAPASSQRTSALRGGRRARAERPTAQPLTAFGSAAGEGSQAGAAACENRGGANFANPAAYGAQPSFATGRPTRAGPTSAASRPTAPASRVADAPRGPKSGICSSTSRVVSAERRTTCTPTRGGRDPTQSPQSCQTTADARAG